MSVVPTIASGIWIASVAIVTRTNPLIIIIYPLRMCVITTVRGRHCENKVEVKAKHITFLCKQQVLRLGDLTNRVPVHEGLVKADRAKKLQKS